MIKKKILFGLCLLFSLSLIACGSGEITPDQEDSQKQLDQIMAAKTRFAISKTTAPLLNSFDWDLTFGGADGNSLNYDRFGEVDELVFVALPDTFFQVQRQVRRLTRSGKETIYYKVTTQDYEGAQSLWVDGRFLDLRDVQPQVEREAASVAKTLISLRRLEGSPYTWHGTSLEGAPELLDYYPPLSDLSSREKSDWMLQGFDSLGMLYYASHGATPVDIESLARFGEPVFIDLSTLTADEGNDDPNALRLKQAKALLAGLKPLDIIQMSDRVWVVLDQSDVIESRYRSKFDGGVQISSLLDTLFGLLQKGIYVKSPFDEIEDPLSKRFFIRRYADTGTLLEDQLSSEDNTVVEENTEEKKTLEPVLFTIDDSVTGGGG